MLPFLISHFQSFLSTPLYVAVATIAVSHTLACFLGGISRDWWSHHHVNALYVRFLATGLHAVALIAATLLCGQALGFQVQSPSDSFIASITVVVGFASKDLIKNLGSGLVIMATMPFDVGDTITCEGKTGIVIQVGFFATKLHTTDNHGLRLPNSKVADGVLVNQTDSFKKDKTGMHRVHIPMHFPVHADLDEVCKVLTSVASDVDTFLMDWHATHHEQWRLDLHLQRFGCAASKDQEKYPSKVSVIGQNIDSGYEVELLCFCTASMCGKVRDEAFRRAARGLRAANIGLFGPLERK